MNIPRLGKHCTNPSCHQLDFLPFTCKHCSKTFCLEHYKSSAHTCDIDLSLQNVMPQCPVCSAYVHVPAGTDVNVVVNAHISSGCTAHLLSASKERAAARREKNTCDLSGCRNPENFATLQCKKCKGSPPLSAPPAKHSKANALMERLKAKKEAAATNTVNNTIITSNNGTSVQTTYSTTSVPASKNKGFTTLQQFRAAAAQAGNKIASVFTPSTTTARSSPSPAPMSTTPSPSPPTPTPAVLSPTTASTVAALAKQLTSAVKIKAVGDKALSEHDRLYLQVQLNSKSVWMFFNKKHTVGRIIDLITDQFGVENENHISTAKKWYVSCNRSGVQQFPFDIPLMMLEPTLVNGDTVTMTKQ